MDGVGISIIERPRPLPGHDTPNPTHHTYTLKCEEPVQAAISGSENVVGAILFGTYWFARIVNELSVHSRLASLRSTTTVETDHPLLSFQLTDARVTADRRTHQFTPQRGARQG